jgi:hypothetical protein
MPVGNAGQNYEQSHDCDKPEAAPAGKLDAEATDAWTFGALRRDAHDGDDPQDHDTGSRSQKGHKA